ncbi:unnamed protein product [Vitrella brassicaformis CCMP3155]|uniref:RING-type E3 ubiquitin transferase n=1 Tax=Vitrella brassicaformis (strain CCMP3155) TaxID=1169540 RepID=A0A0G4H589_VITBC|nr:unnamed protein product [Vitrella brassicaformis CCMP3155]|eukprot:CEM38786.1 unnamed protein product [Vitrella brassicaformis CCMP3155]
MGLYSSAPLPVAPLPTATSNGGGTPDTSPFACRICLEQATEPVVTRCGHLYCWACLHGWLVGRGKRDCPVCKAGVTVDSLIPLYTAGGNEQDPRLRGIPQRPTAGRMANTHTVAIGSGVEALPVDADGFTVMPSGLRYRIVTPGTGRAPTLNDTVEYDYIGWYDAFDGRDKACDRRGLVIRVSDRGALFREAMLPMREGEVRQIILPIESDGPRYRTTRYRQLRLIRIV